MTTEDIGALLRQALPSGVEEIEGGSAYRVRPDDEAGVSRVMRLAHETRVPVRSLVDEPPAGPVIEMDLSGLSEVKAINEVSLVVHAGAGMRVRDLEVVLRDHGYTLGFPMVPHLDPKLGGFLSSQGWAEASVLYGRPESSAIGLTGVLPTGRRFRVKPAPRRAVGPDIASMFLGAEGLLGLVTTAWVRFHTLPKARRIVAAVMPGLAEATWCAARIVHTGVRPGFARIHEPCRRVREGADPEEDTVLVVGLEGEPRLVDVFHGMVTDVIEERAGALQPEDFPLATRPVRAPAGESGHADHLTATVEWNDVGGLVEGVAAVLGDGLEAVRISDFLHEGCAVTWTARVERGGVGHLPAPLVEAAGRLRDLGGTLVAHHGPMVPHPSPLVATDPAFDVLLGRLRATLDPASVL